MILVGTAPLGLEDSLVTLLGEALITALILVGEAKDGLGVNEQLTPCSVKTVLDLLSSIICTDSGVQEIK